MPRQPDLAKRQVWRRRLLEFERGNSTIAEFCRREGLTVRSFYYWRQIMRSGKSAAASGRPRNGTVTLARHGRFADRSPRPRTKPRLKFVPIEITGRASIEVHLPNGTRVTVPCHDRDAIAAVIAALVSDPWQGRESLHVERRPC